MGCSCGLPFWGRLFCKERSDAGVGVTSHIQADQTTAEQAAGFQVLHRPVTEARGRDQFLASPTKAWFCEGVFHVSPFNLAIALHPLLKLLAQVCDELSLRPDADEAAAVRKRLTSVNNFHDVWNPARGLPRESRHG